jgi:hypothetical protein
MAFRFQLIQIAASVCACHPSLSILAFIEHRSAQCGSITTCLLSLFILSPTLSTHHTVMSLRSLLTIDQSRSTSGRNAYTSTNARSRPTTTVSPPPSYRSTGHTAYYPSYDELPVASSSFALPAHLPSPRPGESAPLPASGSRSRRQNSWTTGSSSASIAESTTNSASLASSTTVTDGAIGIRLLTMHYMEESVLTQFVDQYEVCFTSSTPSPAPCHAQLEAHK